MVQPKMPGSSHSAASVRPDLKRQAAWRYASYAFDLLFGLGTTAYVPALDGDIEVQLKPGTQPGEVKSFRSRGVPVLQGYGRGDLKVVVNVLVPRKLTDEQRELLEQFAELSGEATYEVDQSFLDKVRAVFGA